MRTWSALLPFVLLISFGGCFPPPIVRAIKKGETSTVLSLLDEGYDLNSRIGRAQMTPIKLAVSAHRAELVKLLLDRGADINIRYHGTSALSLASLDGDLEMVELLLSKGAEVRKRDIMWAQGRDRRVIVGMMKNAAAVKTPAAPQAAATNAAGDAASPTYKRGERPDDFALVIWIEKYLDAPEAKSSAGDAGAVRRHLIALGWPRRNILTLGGERAGRAAISKYLERWLPNNVNGNSRIFFYFAGNGSADPATGGTYLLPWDGDAGMLEATGYPLARLYEKLNALHAKEVVAVLDAGFSGSGPRSASAKGRAAPVEKLDFGTGALGNVVVFLAASGAEAAGLSDDGRHGTLTRQFLQGLNGGALNAHGTVTVKGLFRFVRESVQEAARRENRTQTPQLLTGTLGESDLRLR